MKSKAECASHLWKIHDTVSTSFTCYKCGHPECLFKETSKFSTGHHIARVHLKVKPEPISCGHCEQTFTR